MVRTAVPALLLAGVVLAPWVIVAAPLRIDVNGDFERVSETPVGPDGGPAPSGWVFNSGFRGSGSWAVVDDASKGVHALRIAALPGKNGVHVFTAAGLPIQRGTDAAVTCTVKGHGSFRVWLYCYDTRVSWVGGNVDGPAVEVAGDTWQTHEFTLPIPEKPFPKGPVEKIRLAIQVSAGGTLTFDCVALQLESPAPPEPEPEVGGGDLELVLPPVLYALPGLETCLYFDNVVLTPNWRNVAFDVDCPKGTQQQERWVFAPTPADVGDVYLQLTVHDETNAVVAAGSTVVRVVSPDAGGALSVLMIGDSLTHASIYPRHVLDLAEGDPVLDVVLVGSHVPDETNPSVRHEGYAGWGAAAFTTAFADEAKMKRIRARSPFLHPGPDGTLTLDFTRYCRDANAGRTPDAVTVFLGMNDVFDVDEAGQAEAISTSLEQLSVLVEMVKKHAPTTAVGLMLPAPPAASQDAFGSPSLSGQTRWQYRRNQHRLVRGMVERFAGREEQGVYLLPTNVVLDPVHGFASLAGGANVHSEVESQRLTNGLLPATPGYQQIGDTVFCWLKALRQGR